MSEPHPVFVLPLVTHEGGRITTRVHVTPATGGIWEQVCKSGGLVLPEDGEPFTITVDDLENRKFFFGVAHDEYLGRKQAAVKFHAQSYSVGINPTLAGVTFANEAPRGIQLKAVAKPSSEPPPPEPPSVPAEPKHPVQPPSETESSPINLEGLESLSDEDFEQALEHAKELRAKKADGWCQD